jgi:beta-1,4-mannooligosaccharide/beta-1,4-mannosyl-N-acetylglucosamine phosphorylase
LDLDEPWKVRYRTAPYLLSPQMPYEQVGDVPNVAFPCAALVDAPTGRIAIYYGGADTVTCLAYAYVDEMIDFVKNNSLRDKAAKQQSNKAAKQHKVKLIRGSYCDD